MIFIAPLEIQKFSEHASQFHAVKYKELSFQAQWLRFYESYNQ